MLLRFVDESDFIPVEKYFPLIYKKKKKRKRKVFGEHNHNTLHPTSVHDLNINWVSLKFHDCLCTHFTNGLVDLQPSGCSLFWLTANLATQTAPGGLCAECMNDPYLVLQCEDKDV